MNNFYPKITKFIPKNIDKYVGNINNITIRSSWERKFAIWCDTNPNVKKWGSEIKSIPYYSQLDKRIRRYYADFWVLAIDTNGNEKKMIIEIKPFSQVPPYFRKYLLKKDIIDNKKRHKKTILNEQKIWQLNYDKWIAAEKYAKTIGFIFMIMTEYELGICKLKNE